MVAGVRTALTKRFPFLIKPRQHQFLVHPVRSGEVACSVPAVVSLEELCYLTAPLRLTTATPVAVPVRFASSQLESSFRTARDSPDVVARNAVYSFLMDQMHFTLRQSAMYGADYLAYDWLELADSTRKRAREEQADAGSSCEAHARFLVWVLRSRRLHALNLCAIKRLARSAKKQVLLVVVVATTAIDPHDATNPDLVCLSEGSFDDVTVKFVECTPH